MLPSFVPHSVNNCITLHCIPSFSCGTLMSFAAYFYVRALRLGMAACLSLFLSLPHTFAKNKKTAKHLRLTVAIIRPSGCHTSTIPSTRQPRPSFFLPCLVAARPKLQCGQVCHTAMLLLAAGAITYFSTLINCTT